jgi:uncharacterized membrane protein
MQDYAMLFEKKYLKMTDAERLEEMKRVTRKRISPMAMLVTLLLIIQSRH